MHREFIHHNNHQSQFADPKVLLLSDRTTATYHIYIKYRTLGSDRGFIGPEPAVGILLAITRSLIWVQVNNKHPH